MTATIIPFTPGIRDLVDFCIRSGIDKVGSTFWMVRKIYPDTPLAVLNAEIAAARARRLLS
jgi:hypothetical protein